MWVHTHWALLQMLIMVFDYSPEFPKRMPRFSRYRWRLCVRVCTVVWHSLRCSYLTLSLQLKRKKMMMIIQISKGVITFHSSRLSAWWPWVSVRETREHSNSRTNAWMFVGWLVLLCHPNQLTKWFGFEMNPNIIKVGRLKQLFFNIFHFVLSVWKDGARFHQRALKHQS